MTVGELRLALAGLDDDLPVWVISQPDRLMTDGVVDVVVSQVNDTPNGVTLWQSAD